MERVTGIEPAFKAWEALILPLNYTRIIEYKFYSLIFTKSNKNYLYCIRKRKKLAFFPFSHLVLLRQQILISANLCENEITPPKQHSLAEVYRLQHTPHYRGSS